jgi:hypothetical protein
VPGSSAAGIPGPAGVVPDPISGLSSSAAGRERQQAARCLTPAPAAEIAAQATRLVTLCYGADLPAADRDELERSVLAQVEAALVLRRYPLLNSDEPMLGNGQELGWPR